MTMAANFKNYLLRGAEVNTLPRMEMMPYHEATVARWRKEGLPESVRTLPEFHDYFGLTPLDFFFVWPDVDDVGCRERIASLADFSAVRAHLYDLENLRGRLDSYSSTLDTMAAQDGILWVPLHGFFWHPRDLLGIADHLMAFCTQPELMHEINMELLDFNVQAVRMLYSEGVPAIICVSEDMAYKTGSMISEAMFEEFMAPYHRVLAAEIKREDCVAAVDTDGDVSDVIPWFARVGYACISPMERQTGMDLLALREANPDMAFLGGFNKRVVSKGPEAIAAEFEDLKPVFRRGRFIPAMDHQTPPEVSLENYRHYLKAQETFFSEMMEE